MSKSTSKTGELVMIVDILSSQVRGSLVHYQAKRKPNIIFQEDVTLRTGEQYDDILESVSTTISEINRQFILAKHLSVFPEYKRYQHLAKNISKIHYVLASPWIVSQAQLISTQYPKNVSVSAELIKKILAQKEIGIKTHATRNIGVKLVEIERKVIGVLLNGYTVHNWSGQKAKDIEISCVISAISASLLKSLEQAAETVVKPQNVFIHSALMLQYTTSVQEVPEANSHVCLHIHDEVTDVISLNKNGEVFFGSYPVGVNTVLKRVQAALGSSFHAAASLLSLYNDEHLDISYSRNIRAVIEKVVMGWNHEYREFLKTAGVPLHTKIHVFVKSNRFNKLFAKHARIPSVNANIETVTENVYAEAIGML